MNAKGLVRPKFVLFMLLGLLLVLLLAPVAQASVSTDKPDYAPGSVVTVTGDNFGLLDPWAVGAEVTVDVVGPYGYQFEPLTTTVGLDGSWSVQLTLSDDPVVAVGEYTFTARAAGSFEAQGGSFADAPNSTLTLNDVSGTSR